MDANISFLDITGLDNYLRIISARIYPSMDILFYGYLQKRYIKIGNLWIHLKNAWIYPKNEISVISAERYIAPIYRGYIQ